MIDQDTFERFENARQQAREQGVPLIEALDHRSLLWTAQRERNVRLSVLEDLLRRMELQSPNRLMSFYLDRTTGSASEMFEAIKLWVETVYGHIAKGTLEDL